MIKSNKKSKEETATMEDNVVTEKNNKETEEKQLEAMTGNNKHKSDGDDEGVKNIKKKNKTKKSKQNISVVSLSCIKLFIKNLYIFYLISRNRASVNSMRCKNGI